MPAIKARLKMDRGATSDAGLRCCPIDPVNHAADRRRSEVIVCDGCRRACWRNATAV